MAKVITTVLKFPDDQAQKILEREDARLMFTSPRSGIFWYPSVRLCLVSMCHGSEPHLEEMERVRLGSRCLGSCPPVGLLENGAVITGHWCSLKADATLASDTLLWKQALLVGRWWWVCPFLFSFFLGSFLWFKGCSDWPHLAWLFSVFFLCSPSL